MIKIKNLTKKFKSFKKKKVALSRLLNFLKNGFTKSEEFEVLKNINFNVRDGEILGIIGKNGSGKTTLLRTIAKIYDYDFGNIELDKNKKIVSLIGLNIGLKPRLIMKDNIYLCGSLFGLSKSEIKKKIDSIVNFAELKDFVNTPLNQFSSGMKERLVFSIAIQCNPDVLLLDEVFAVGDEEFKRKSVKKIKSLVSKGTSILFVSHSLDIIENNCSRAMWMENGKIKKIGKPKEIIKEYKEENEKR